MSEEGSCYMDDEMHERYHWYLREEREKNKRERAENERLARELEEFSSED